MVAMPCVATDGAAGCDEFADMGGMQKSVWMAPDIYFVTAALSSRRVLLISLIARRGGFTHEHMRQSAVVRWPMMSAKIL